MQLFDIQRRPLGLATPLDRGGEAEIYQMSGSPFRVAKIYHPQHRTAERRRKLELMIADPPDDPENARGHASIAWPTELVVDAHGAFLGFLMPGIDTGATRKLVDVYNVSSYPKGLTWADLLLVARNLAVALAALHQKGYVVGDLNESNLLVARNDLITFVDCDSMQVRDAATGQVFRCPVGKGEYSPPELQGVSFGAVDRTPESDAFALAVMISQLLFLGRHPFAGGSNPRVEDNILRQDSFLLNGGQPPAGTPSPNVLPARILDLFLRCFREGHGEPRRRPAADDWADALDAAHRNLRTCPKSQVHRYSAHLADCPWCRYEQDYGFDPFTYRWQQIAAAPRPVSSLTVPAAPPRQQVVWTVPRKRSTWKGRTGMAAALAGVVGLGLYFAMDRSPIRVFQEPAPSRSSQFKFPLTGILRNPQALVGSYTGLLEPSRGGRPVVTTLHIRSVSEPELGRAAFRYTLNTLDQREDGIGRVLDAGMLYLSDDRYLDARLDSRGQIVIEDMSTHHQLIKVRQ
jgi:DNA-binding helix-hairpin-helix protein with protein kinase domain